MRAGKWGLLLTPPTHWGRRWGGREELDSAGAAQTLDWRGFVTSPLRRVLSPDRFGGAGGLGRCGGAMGQSLTALLSQKIQKERHKLLSADLEQKVLGFTNVLSFEPEHCLA